VSNPSTILPVRRLPNHSGGSIGVAMRCAATVVAVHCAVIGKLIWTLLVRSRFMIAPILDASISWTAHRPKANSTAPIENEKFVAVHAEPNPARMDRSKTDGSNGSIEYRRWWRREALNSQTPPRERKCECVNRPSPRRATHRCIPPCSSMYMIMSLRHNDPH
jgi:hypothetical protein